MAKKKRRYKRKTAPKPRTSCDMHHLLWIGRKWEIGELALLRQHWYCKISIPRDTLHRYIHENVSTIPTPSRENAREVLRHLQYLEQYEAIHDSDDICKRLALLIALFDSIEPKTAEALKRQLATVHEFYN